MRGSFSLVFVSVGVAGWLHFGCGSDSGGGGFQCSEQAIAHGQAVNCEAAGAFGSGGPYTCEHTASISPKTEIGGSPPVVCPEGTSPAEITTIPVADSTDPNASSSSGASGSSSSGGSSSGATSSSSGGSSSGESTSGGSTSGESTSGGSSSGASGSSSSGGSSDGSCDLGYRCASRDGWTHCECNKCDDGYHAVKGTCVAKEKGNNGVGNGLDPQPPGDPPINDGVGTSPGNPGNRGGP